jgi:glycosyltransferase involved in cell wall biosynthesis
MQVSLIATILNEGEALSVLLDSIIKQSYPPDEVVICDGGSEDQTLSVLDSYQDRLPLKVIQRPGANISEGRNAAIRVASYPLIAVTDAGVRLSPSWLEHLIAPLRNPQNRVSAGFFLPDAQGPFEVAMGAAVLPQVNDINPATFMPSSRSVAFRREAWEQVGGYPEWLDYCEDLVFDFRLFKLCGPFAFVPEAVVFFRPRTSLSAFLKQYYLYSRGDGKAHLFPRRHAIRYLTYGPVLPLLIGVSIIHHPLWSVILFAGGLYMFWTPYRRLFQQWQALTTIQKLVAILWIAVIRIGGDVAKMAGYPAGVLWRLRNHPTD